MRILIVKRDKLGDLLLTTPLIAQLRRSLPQAEVCVLASEYCGWVVRDDPDLARLWTYPRLRAGSFLRPTELWRFWKAYRNVRASRFDVAIAAGGEYSVRAIQRALAAKARRTIAYAPAGHPFGRRLTDPVPPPEDGHEMERMLALAAPLGVPMPADPPPPRYSLPGDKRAFGERWMAERGLRAQGFVVIGLGARKRVRQPVPEQVLRWSRRLQALGLQTVLMWTPGRGSDLYPGDDDLAEPILAERRPEIHPFRGPLGEALGLIWHAASSVFPDSGLMHFAAASPGGVVGLFAGAPAWPEQWAPRGPKARWLLHPAAIAELPDAQLFGALEPLLEAPPSAAQALSASRS